MKHVIIDKNDTRGQIMDESHNDIVKKAIKGETQDAWENLMKMYNISNKDCYYHTAGLQSSGEKAFVNDVIAPLFNDIDNPDVHKTVAILKSCATAHNYNNSLSPSELKYKMHSHIQAMESIIPLLDDNLKHEAYNSLSIMYKDAGYSDKQVETLEKALDISPSRYEAVKYASRLEIQYSGNHEKIINAYEKALSKPSNEQEDKNAIRCAHLQVGIAYASKVDKSKSDIAQGANHFEQAISMSDNIGQKIDALGSYTSLYPVGSQEAGDVARRYNLLKRINEASKQVSKETKAPLNRPKVKDFTGVSMMMSVQRN